MLRGDGIKLTGASLASGQKFVCPGGTQNMKEGFHNPLPKEFPSTFERKAEGSRKDMAAPGTGHFRQREASCKIGKEGL